MYSVGTLGALYVMLLKKALESCQSLNLTDGSDRVDLLVGPVSEVVHDDLQLDLMVWRAEDRLIIIRYQSVVVKLVKFIHQRWFGHWLRTVIRQPTSDVPVQIGGQGVEEILR